MNLVDSIKKDSIQAMKEKDKFKLSVLRLLIAEFEKERILKTVDELTEEQVLSVINRQVKKLEKEKEAYEKAGILSDAQDKEKEILLRYLPVQLSEEDIRSFVSEYIEGIKATPNPNFGMVMKGLTQQLKGKADMKFVSQIAKEEF